MTHPTSTIRTTEQIYADIITRAYYTAAVDTALAGDLYAWYAWVGRLWREMEQAADREQMPALGLAAALLADDYDRRARGSE